MTNNDSTCRVDSSPMEPILLTANDDRVSQAPEVNSMLVEIISAKVFIEYFGYSIHGRGL